MTQPTATRAPHVLNLGFRVFFVGAGLFAIVTMTAWMLMLQGQWVPDATPLGIVYGHEMIYGYALAVIAGFLLTAVRNWTGQQTPYGWHLFALFLPWVIARVLWLMAGDWMTWAALFDGLFWLLTCVALIRAIVAVKQYRQPGVVIKLLLLAIGNGLCYAGMMLGHISWVRVGLYLGFYLVIGLVLMIGRRVMPFFINRGLGVEVRNAKWLDITSMIAFVVFFVADVFVHQPWLLSAAALVVAVTNGWRLLLWHQKGIWGKSLLWSLYLAFWGITLSMFLFAIQPWAGFSHSLATHGLALFGIGLTTISMMARVSLGHTGRNIHQPPKLVVGMFVLMMVSAVSRAWLPLLDWLSYTACLHIAQATWILAFLLFCVAYLPILMAPRVDGKFG